ncbi:hypothetical protein BAUCODRAFT_152246 [Baudoinia panamericana UAMH 10762]|uniref:Major facilitator superfamily (MFS) profile domain-containing protein n=1 Tax=Baudoinia panamericana (strain UAMH 10762) TaxID=717646 RepID=M2MYX4_BAUPA|nr:uncharacterized protein BAUCODRAFT_152246 [Baudoinia panamericana UAMH 10762]EMC91884.1 hypothetical protein BAUCODRAFT_152246 [Baudoinia panamericana UAMH 10762]
MATFAFAAGLRVESRMNVASPDVAKTPQRAPNDKELEAIELPDYGHFKCSAQHYNPEISPAEPQKPAAAKSGAHTPSSPQDLEASLPPTPRQHEVTSMVPSFSYPPMNRFRVLAACLVYLGNGLNDSAPGALLPYMEAYYHIGYAVVSTIWIANAVGFILAAFCTDVLHGRVGRARALMISETIMTAGYVMIVCSPPFPAVAVAFFLIGFGYALNLALNNVFCANLANSTAILGASHGSYGIGGIVGPIIATALVSRGVLWSRFYLITIGVRIVCFCFAGWSFWNYENEGTTQFSNSLQQFASRQAAAEMGEPTKLQLLGWALRNKTTIIGALFIFAYQGAEVSESGWFISYLINYRDGNPAKVGYVTSGFWAGITLGRFILVHAANRIGEKVYVVGLTAGVIVFQLIAWFVPNVIGDSVAVAIVGLLLGPVYPCAQTIFTRLLPGNLQTTAIGFIAGAGSSGGAVVPFLTGLLAQAFGTWVLHPVCIGFYCFMLGCWALLPRIAKRTE